MKRITGQSGGARGNQRRPRPRSVNISGRLKLVAALMGCACAVLIVRSVDLQLLHNDFYQREGNARFMRTVPIAASRGMIVDRNGEPLAVSSPMDSISANPRILLEQEEALAELADALEIPLPALQKRLQEHAERKKEFVWLRRHVDPDRAERILGMKIPGVMSQREFRRFYPLGDAAAHIIGFTNVDDQGQEGLELAYDDWLAGKPGAKRVIRDGKGREIANVDLIRAAESGRQLVLSIDRRMQHLAHRELARALEENHAEAGSVVVLDVENGEVLAMVNQPAFNPNVRKDSTTRSRRNRAVTDVFEPGSTFKPFIVAAALELGTVTPDTVIDTWPGTIQVAGHTVRDVRNFGTLTTTSMLTKSSNVGAVKVSQDMPSEHIYHVLRRFGFGETTGIGFPGESSGVLATSNTWGTLAKATISFGYGVSVTPLQLAQAYAAIGNGGELITPSFLRGAERRSHPVIDPGITHDLLAMLETVTGPEGTARRAAIPGYRVAGKSGTSRKATSGGYERRYISVFAGLVPASKPRYSVVVMIDDPQSRDEQGNQVYYGGAVAAPVFQRVMDGALRLMDVPPDDIEQWFVASAQRGKRSDAEIMPMDADASIDIYEATP